MISSDCIIELRSGSTREFQYTLNNVICLSMSGRSWSQNILHGAEKRFRCRSEALWSNLFQLRIHIIQNLAIDAPAEFSWY